jgi:MscS family membrane protein
MLIVFLSFLNDTFYHNTIQNWLIAISILTASVVLAKAIYWLISKILFQIAKRTSTKLDDVVIEKIDAPVALGIILIGFRFAVEQLTFTRVIDNYLQRGFVFMSAIAITWLLTRVIRAIIEVYFQQLAEKDNLQADTQMIGFSKKAALIVVWSIGFVVGLNNAGFDVGALIAGLGIGGLAVALAAQDTVKNMIGGLIIFIDRPFIVGDRVKVSGYDGFVVYTGMRSTRIRTLEGRLVTIPNHMFTDNSIENVTLETSRRVKTTLSLVYETAPEMMDKAIAILKEIAIENPGVHTSDTIAYFQKFNDYSLDIEFIYFIKKDTEILNVQHQINTEILKRFNAVGLSFAYPTELQIQR